MKSNAELVEEIFNKRPQGLVDHVESFASLLNFSNPDYVYLLAVVSRLKDDPRKEKGATNTSDKRSPIFVERRVVKNMQDYFLSVASLLNHADTVWDDYRLYITYNPRSVKKAYYNLWTKLQHAVIFKHEEAINYMGQLDTLYKSELHKKSAKAVTHYHMLDIDLPEIPEEIFNAGNPGDVQIAATYKTRNGWNVLINPTRPYLFDDIPGVSWNQDSMINIFIK